MYFKIYFWTTFEDVDKHFHFQLVDFSVYDMSKMLRKILSIPFKLHMYVKHINIIIF